MGHSQGSETAEEGRDRDLEWGIAWTAHELRGPVVAARAAVDRVLALNGRVTDPDGLLRRSRRELEQLSEMVDSLLRYSTGCAGLQRRRMNLDKLVRQVAESCALEWGEGRVEVRGTGRTMVCADRGQLRSVIENLIRNALCFSPPGEPVIVEVAATGDGAALSVTDRGPGVAPGDRERVFELFTAGRNGHSTPTGRGLGLFIARRVVEAHRGRIWVESNGSGSTFRVRLPVAA